MEHTSRELLLKRHWALLDVEFIRISSTHRCIRKLYILTENGQSNMELEFLPCVPYSQLERKYQKSFNFCRRNIHRLSYNPEKYSPGCRQVLALLKEFIVSNSVELILYKGGTIERDLCNEMNILSFNIEYLHGLKKVSSHDSFIEVNCYFSQIMEVLK